jgi:acyl-CoA thioester hydrolase
MLSSYSKVIAVPQSAIDENGHANNVVFVQWMQDIAVEHYGHLGGLEAQQTFGTWFVRKHEVEYLGPAQAGEEIEIRTWVADIQRVRSLRKYEFVRKLDGKILVKGQTEWVFVDAKSGRPVAIPEEVRAVFRPAETPSQGQE